MLFSSYESMLSVRLANIDSKSSHSRNFIVGECYGIVRTALQDPDIMWAECAKLWNMIAHALQQLSLSDFTTDDKESDNLKTFAKMYELCLSAVDDALAEYAEYNYNDQYTKGVLDGLIMYCDIYCNCPEELAKIKARKNKIIYNKS